MSVRISSFNKRLTVGAAFVSLLGAPMAAQDATSNRAPAAEAVQAAAPALFDRLGRGDVLFIDSSHILMPGSDVDLMLNRVLPRLPSGVIVHIHDIFLPFDYPSIWGWRAYNEQQGVVPLMATGAYVPLFSSVWAERRLADRLARSVVARLPTPQRALATSLWLEKR